MPSFLFYLFMSIWFGKELAFGYVKHLDTLKARNELHNLKGFKMDIFFFIFEEFDYGRGHEFFLLII